MLTVEQKYRTYADLKRYGNWSISRQLKKGIHITEELYDMTRDLVELYEDMVYYIELDHADTKEFHKTHKNYRQCCKIIVKTIKEDNKRHVKST